MQRLTYAPEQAIVTEANKVCQLFFIFSSMPKTISLSEIFTKNFLLVFKNFLNLQMALQ
jgi:hypothetical protein